MNSISRSIFALLFTFTIYSCGTNANVNKSTKTPPEKIIYHASRCFGFCPRIDLQIDDKRNIIVNREIYLSKSGTDSSRSGLFKGVLDEAKYDQLLKLLDSSDYKNLKFPDVQCCDGVITTLIIYNDSNRIYLKSMTPPEQASALLSFLKKLGTDLELTRTTEEFTIEE